METANLVRQKIKFRNAQSGVALPITLMVLVAMMFAAVTLVRSVDTATLVAGNLTFKQRAILAGDDGLRQAFGWMRNAYNISPATLSNSNIGIGYYSTRHADDPNWNPANNWPAGAVTLPQDAGGNTVSYVVHRLCTLPNAAYNAPNQKCVMYVGGTASSSGGSQSIDAPDFEGVTYVYYRVTARINGPRNTVSYIQSMVLLPAS